MDVKAKMIQALAVLSDMYQTEAENKTGLYEPKAVLLKAKAEAVNECIELLEELDI